MKRWTLSQSSFDQFLAVFHPDRERAGLEYESLRSRIIRYFEWRNCSDPDDLADETLDRVVRKVSEGAEILDIASYSFGVARLVLLENLKKPGFEPIVVDFPSNRDVDEDKDDENLNCLERCLRKISAEQRDLILRYYTFDKKAKIDDRKMLADGLGLSLNALRIKALRIRSKIENCVKECLGGEN